MSVLFCRDCGVDISGEPLFRRISFALENGEKAALVGPNGAGKTTLIWACLGDIRLEGGEVQILGSFGYLPQTPIVEDEGNVFECVIQERADLLQMQEQLRELEEKMATMPSEKVMEQYAALTESFERQGGYALEALVRRILAGLGLEAEMNSQVARLSGGQKTRLALCKLLLRAPELLILDEPTNHLDIEAMEWLEGYLRDYPGALLIVSHDRYFLDRTVSRVFCLEYGGLKGYTGNYSEYELLKVLEAKTLGREADRLANRIAKLEEYVRRNKAGVNSKQARGRESQLQKLKPIQAPKVVDHGLSISLGSGGRSGDRVLLIEDLSIAFSNRTLFSNVQLDLRRGDRVALLGKNGVGKTTILKAILDQTPFKGTIRLGANVKIAYYSQEHENLGISGTVMDEIRHVSNLKDPEIRSLLARYGFRKDDVFKLISVLSGGEKSRLALCKLFLDQGNLLLLDEPTNHLDAETRGVLEDALQEYEGTVLVVSHDRYFLDKVVNKIAELTAQGLLLFEGDYTGFKEHKQEKMIDVPIERNTKPSSQDQQESRHLAREKKRMKQLELEIEELEKALQALEEELAMANTNYELAMKLHEECEKLKQRRDCALEEWIAGND